MKKLSIFLVILTIIFISLCTIEECEPNWECSEWGECIVNKQARTCIDASHCNVTTGKPDELKDCVSCLENWNCTDWASCTAQGTQTRNCTDLSNCSTTSRRPELSQNCTPLTCYEDSDCKYVYLDCLIECKERGYTGPLGNMYCEDNECFCHCAIEVCDNGEDDDKDGFTDCQDIDCGGVCPPCHLIPKPNSTTCWLGNCTDNTTTCTYVPGNSTVYPKCECK